MRPTCGRGWVHPLRLNEWCLEGDGWPVAAVSPGHGCGSRRARSHGQHRTTHLFLRPREEGVCDLDRLTHQAPLRRSCRRSRPFRRFLSLGLGPVGGGPRAGGGAPVRVAASGAGQDCAVAPGSFVPRWGDRQHVAGGPGVAEPGQPAVGAWKGRTGYSRISPACKRMSHVVL